jgi:hypothetical protein
VVGNTVKFYEYNSREEWEEITFAAFNLPNGYKSVFGYRIMLGVVVGNTVKFYKYDINRNEWEENTSAAFNLPNGYKSVFGFKGGDALGVVVGNTVKFYYEDEGSWKEEPSLAFNLPNGYKSVFAAIDGGAALGVVVGESIKFYVPEGEDDIWVEYPSLTFTLKSQTTPNTQTGSQAVLGAYEPESSSGFGQLLTRIEFSRDGTCIVSVVDSIFDTGMSYDQVWKYTITGDKIFLNNGSASQAFFEIKNSNTLVTLPIPMFFERGEIWKKIR